MAELTEGKVEVQVFPNSALGNHRDMLEGIKMETIQMTKCMATDLSAYFPKVQVFGLPYMFDSTEHLLRVVDGEVGDYFNEKIFPAEDFVLLHGLMLEVGVSITKPDRSILLQIRKDFF